MSEQSEHQGLPIPGYRPQTTDALNIVSEFKRDEERLLRKLDALHGDHPLTAVDGRWLAIGRTQLEQAFMAINRSIFKPSRVALAEDEAPENPFD